uniref:F-box domain-containing protein n=1 Tax=Oryza brachyantha TaxID=4533 RepID=J3LKD7_ORYBR
MQWSQYFASIWTGRYVCVFDNYFFAKRRVTSCDLVSNSCCSTFRVDGGLKTVVSARKFVPGAKLCMQPDIKPNKRKSRSSRKERCRTQAPLLPGLPDDLAINCLMRVPRVEHPNLRLVCKRWNRLLSGNYYYSLRKKLGMAEEWVFVFKRDRDRKISWHAFDPVHQVWKSLPPVPPEYSEAVGFGCAVLSGCYLYLFGGKDPVRGSMRRVVFYNARINKWLRAPDMLEKRHCFGSCVINNRLYVAGGECEGIQRTLRSAEFYDPNRNRWSKISEMSTGMVPFIGVVYDGKWFLKGLDSHRQVVSEVYMPTSNVWSISADEMVAGWRNPSISFNGRLYSADCRDGCKLRVYDGDTRSWTRFIDSRRHLGSSRAFEAAALVSLNGKICIIRNNMSITLVDVSNTPTVIEINSAHMWDIFARKGQHRSFIANLWLTISGRHFKTHIIHCQVLQV